MLKSIFRITVKIRLYALYVYYHFKIDIRGRNRSRSIFSLIVKFCMRVLSHASANCLSFLLSLFWILNFLHRVQLLFAFLMNDGVIKHIIRNHQAIAFGPICLCIGSSEEEAPMLLKLLDYLWMMVTKIENAETGKTPNGIRHHEPMLCKKAIHLSLCKYGRGIVPSKLDCVEISFIVELLRISTFQLWH
ncbi:unnamed protein product [Albugo candida]|uniref:Uncharacterized protein n=1 Tax=Albugo candida TaxID=65357 RepID=A0A024GIJ3_9STRA|nr:unnamed protein product [Albugo candida]|eukprot:CCI46511.1 unnamed protein product [Albugo candida]